MGGISTSVRSKYATSTLKVAEGEEQEYLITRHDQFDPVINVINLYGTQESRSTSEEIKDDWDMILKEISKVEAKKESVLLVGDLNCHIGNKLVKRNHNKYSVGGKLLEEFLLEDQFTLVNSLNCV